MGQTSLGMRLAESAIEGAYRERFAGQITNYSTRGEPLTIGQTLVPFAPVAQGRQVGLPAVSQRINPFAWHKADPSLWNMRAEIKRLQALAASQ